MKSDIRINSSSYTILEIQISQNLLKHQELYETVILISNSKNKSFPNKTALEIFS